VEVSAATQGPVLETRDFYMPTGSFDVMLSIAMAPSSGSSPSAVARSIGSVELVDHVTNAVLSTSAIPPVASREAWHEVTVPLQLRAIGRHVRLRLTSAGATPFALASIDIPVDYSFKVVDLTETLNSFNTHTSIFDAHPNEDAQKIIAEKVFEALRQPGSRH
jgi:hypothetical protein